jgi:import inner membrane translocase subunit TIM50
MFGKAMKYTAWLTFSLYLYHTYVVFKHEKPEEAFAVNERMLWWGWWTRTAYHDLKELLTMPPVKCLLGERPPPPPGYSVPKTLVLNVNGTLVHAEYKVSLYSNLMIFQIVRHWV